MAIFDDVVVNAKSAASVVSKKAGEIFDLSKLRISLASLRGELSKQYQALGEAVYNNEPAEELDAIKEEIAALKQNVADIENVLANARNTVTCTACGEKLSKNAKFCSTCGTPAPKPKNTCVQCGAKLVDNAKFCAACGTAVAVEEEPEEEPKVESEEA
ncbi:MAG: zinc ribbon domain-containing protein [Ruminococcus sp.]|nr:zinc ribbon domain-containing protein [Ruminococcus sp.]